MRFQNQRVYVTGATGFIGGVVTRKLVDEGAEVTALVRRPEKAGALRQLGVNLHQGNVVDPATIRIPEGTDLVVHAAAWVSFGIPKSKRALYWKTNVEGTRNVLGAARDAGVPKAVHVSSVAALGATDSGKEADERTPRAPTYRSFYEETKTAAHQAALEAGIPVAIPMPGIVMGPGGPFEPVVKAFARERLFFVPKGGGPKPWVHVDDVAEGILLMALKGEGPYLLVSENLLVSELFARLQHSADVTPRRVRVPIPVMGAAAAAVETAYHLMGRVPPVSRELTQSLRESMRFTSERARRELGWKDDFWGRVTTDVRMLKKPGKGKSR